MPQHVGVGLSLDGEEDNKLRKQCVSFWHEQGIPAARERIKAAIDIGIRTGDLTSWDQYTELLEPYDAHAPLVEGEEIERERLGDPDDDDGVESFLGWSGVSWPRWGLVLHVCFAIVCIR